MTDDDRALLQFEEQHPRNNGRKENLATERFGYSMTRYFQRIISLMDDPDAVAAFPALVHRMERHLAAGRRRKIQ